MNTLSAIQKCSTSFSRVFRFVWQGVLRFYGIFLRPKSHSEDEQVRERILNIILFGILVLAVIADSDTLIQTIVQWPNYEGQSIFILVGITVVFGALYIASRKGYYRISSHIFLILFFLFIVHGSFAWGVSLPMGLLCYALFIVMATIMLGSRYGLIATLLVVVTIFGIGSREVKLATIAEWKQHPIKTNDLVAYAVVLSVASLLAWLSRNEMEKSLKRARKSEHLLAEERDNLEVLVVARTEALRQAEREHVAELYRFAEFGKISAGLFHDLINPLTAVSLTVDTLQTNSATASADTKKAINTAIATTRRMEQYMQTIRKKIKTTDTMGQFSAQGEMREAVDMFRYAAREKQVEMVIKGKKETVLFGNPLKFNQAISNLIANAIDAYDGASTHATRKVRITSFERNGMLIITVQDSGSGISKECLDKIFTPFFTTKNKGIGLGLATTKDIIEQHFGGIIQVASSKGHTVFTLSIPIIKQ